jgi:hypothetical protein
MSDKRLVLILSQQSEPGTNAVVAHLHEMNVPHVRLDYEFLCLKTAWTFHVTAGDFRLDIEKKAITRPDVGCIWNRRWGIPFFPKTYDNVEATFAFNEVNKGLAHYIILQKVYG